MLKPEHRVVLLQHGGLADLSGKTGLTLLRYRRGPVVAVVDPDQAGRSLLEVSGINRDVPVVASLDEALAMAQLARRLGLGVMRGCYSDGALLNGAAAQLLPLVRWPDLDSHLNLVDDPFVGLELRGEVLLPPQGPGIGVAPAGELKPC